MKITKQDVIKALESAWNSNDLDKEGARKWATYYTLNAEYRRQELVNVVRECECGPDGRACSFCVSRNVEMIF